MSKVNIYLLKEIRRKIAELPFKPDEEFNIAGIRELEIAHLYELALDADAAAEWYVRAALQQEELREPLSAIQTLTWASTKFPSHLGVRRELARMRRLVKPSDK